MLVGAHKKQREKSDFHMHDFICTTNLETVKLLHPTNNFTFTMAQRMADIIQKLVALVIEKKNKSPEPVGDGDNNTEKKNDFTRIFYPHNTPQRLSIP